MLHSFRVQPAGWLVRDCALGRYGIGPTFWRPQPARDGPAWTREMTSPQRYGTGRDGPTCLTSLV
ncbi:BnaA07g01540D [Brassica napus]|uniref:BnaA07g01540D protein n=1 Tax=Brassica napus TaxID=3708 RepID=A0A078IJR0_BRANA|nr:BnaA07g01540D [Brassica napus]